MHAAHMSALRLSDRLMMVLWSHTAAMRSVTTPAAHAMINVRRQNAGSAPNNDTDHDRGDTPAQGAAASSLLLAGGRVMGDAAVGVLAIAGMHQQQHGALQLLCPVPPLLVAKAHACLINPPCLSLQHRLVAVTATFTDIGETLPSCHL